MIKLAVSRHQHQQQAVSTALLATVGPSLRKGLPCASFFMEADLPCLLAALAGTSPARLRPDLTRVKAVAAAVRGGGLLPTVGSSCGHLALSALRLHEVSRTPLSPFPGPSAPARAAPRSHSHPEETEWLTLRTGEKSVELPLTAEGTRFKGASR